MEHGCFDPSEEPKNNTWSRVTPLSKYLAMIIFIIMPFLGVWIGYTYAPEKITETETIVIKEVPTEEILEAYIPEKEPSQKLLVPEYSADGQNISFEVPVTYNEDFFVTMNYPENVKILLIQEDVEIDKTSRESNKTNYKISGTFDEYDFDASMIIASGREIVSFDPFFSNEIYYDSFSRTFLQLARNHVGESIPYQINPSFTTTSDDPVYRFSDGDAGASSETYFALENNFRPHGSEIFPPHIKLKLNMSEGPDSYNNAQSNFRDVLIKMLHSLQLVRRQEKG